LYPDNLGLACTSGNPKRDANPKVGAAKYRVDDAPGSTANDPHHYEDLLKKVESNRRTLALGYRQATSRAERVRILAQAREVLISSIYGEIFPPWYSTAWDFNGTTEVPRQGNIACGYFVSTILRDSGWRVRRAQLAQQASENIILSLTTDPYIKRFRRLAIGDFVETWGSGIYVVGLDIHTGFIVNNGDEVYFIHSSNVEPFAVVKERPLDSKILQVSQYRVLGKITDDNELIEKWLRRKEIITKVA
jgi:hypothetical protein